MVQTCSKHQFTHNCVITFDGNFEACPLCSALAEVEEYKPVYDRFKDLFITQTKMDKAFTIMATAMVDASSVLEAEVERVTNDLGVLVNERKNQSP